MESRARLHAIVSTGFTAVVTVVVTLALTGVGCGPRETDSLVRFTNAGRLKAYAFGVINVTDSPISGVHLRMKGEPSAMPPVAPRHWAGNHTGDGLHFVTPPPEAVGSRTDRPVLPGRAVGTFRFCLDDERTIDEIRLMHPDGSTTTAPDGSITVGEMPLDADDDGTIPLRPERDVFSFTLLVSAPESRPVGRVQFEIVGDGAIAGAVAGSDWRVAPSDRKVSCWGTPILPGESRRFTLCADRPKLDITWSLVGEDLNAVGEGTRSLAFATP